MTLTYKGGAVTFDMPGWYCSGSEKTMHTGADMEVSDRMLKRLKARAERLPEQPKLHLAERIRAPSASLDGADDPVIPSREPGREPPHFDTEQLMLGVFDLRRTCIACPSQWEGRIGEHGSIYIRYRWGKLTARISLTDAHAASTGTCIYDDDIGSRTGDRLGGYMDTEEMCRLLRHVCHFSGGCDEDNWQSQF